MKERLLLVFIRVALAVPAALIAVEVLSLVGMDRHHWSWVGIIGAVAGIAASFVPRVIASKTG